MKQLLIGILVLFFSGCALQQRSTNKETREFELRDQSIIETKRPGDIIVMDFPRTERPRNTIKTYTGPKGATSTKTFDEKGYITSDIVECPEEEETKRLDITVSSEERIKETERKMNIEIAKQVKQTIWGVALVFAIAWVVRGIAKR